eukprot:TRINITY_DN110819_c0_g1_i1.p1 TRINITY_DN110819_c0_g1~~TRINITY_DN110819_c0_g1_i1.p1  ORF type:complete len:490 (-),score=99.55 TRINITY_DN110819_c0_g1_i1:91-1533(-)
MAAATLRQTRIFALLRACNQDSKRRIVTCAERLSPVEDQIRLGLRGRLSGQRVSDGPPRIAIAGRHSADFAVALRATRQEGAVAAPVDISGRSAEELAEVFAEGQIDIAVVAGALPDEDKSIREAASRLGTSVTCVHSLCNEGLNFGGEGTSAAQTNAPVLLFATSALNGGASKAAEVSQLALDSRISGATSAWKFSKEDMVLSLGLSVESSAALVDAVEAPLKAGAQVALAEQNFPRSSSTKPDVWALWAALHEHPDATVLFIDSRQCRELVDAYSSLAISVRRELQSRWGSRPFRHTVALAPPGTTLSQELSERWTEIFHSPLTWHFSCAEAGSLYTVRLGQGLSHIGHPAEGLEWRLEEGNLHVKGASVFQRYHGRPRSTEEAFDEDGFFCQTGHRAELEGASLKPLPQISDLQEDKDMLQHLTKEPNTESFPSMMPSWNTKQVPMRRYEKWRAAWGGLLFTKKHNQANKVYQSRYK